MRVVALLAIACVSAVPASAQTAPPLRVVATLADAYAEAYYAQDEVFFTEPSLSQAKATFRIRELANTSHAIVPRYLSSAWFTNAAFADKNPDVTAAAADARPAAAAPTPPR